MLALTPAGITEGQARAQNVVEWLQQAARSEVTTRASAVVAAAIVVGCIARVWFIRRALARRVSVAVLPADEFDPSVEEVRQFARKLNRVGRALTARWLRPAAGVRVRLESAPAGEMLYRIDGPAAGRSVIQTHMFNKVMVVDPGEVQALAVLGSAGGGGESDPDPPENERLADDEPWPDEEPWT